MKKSLLLFLSVILVLCSAGLCSCGASSPSAETPSPAETTTAAPADTAAETKAAAPSAPETPPLTEAQTIFPDTLPEPVEGEPVEEAAFREKGAAPGTIVMSGLQEDGTTFGGFYVYPAYPVPEYDEDREDAYRYKGQSLTLFLHNTSDPAMSLRSGNVAVPEDFSYILAQTDGLAYVSLEKDDENAAAIPDLEITLKKEDESFERYGVLGNGYVLRAFGSGALAEPAYTEISAEPVPEIVSLHLAAEAFRYAHGGTDVSDIAFHDGYPAITGVAAACHGKTVCLSGEALERFVAVYDSEKPDGK